MTADVRDFFDRDYSRREVARRVARLLRPYRFRLFAGLFCGLLTAGTLVPVFQLVRPSVVAVERSTGAVQSEAKATASASAPDVPKELKTAEKYARRFGLTLTDEKGVLKGGFLLLVIIVVPLVAGVRLGFKFLSQYCLSWVGAHAAMDLSCALMEHAERQSLQFYGRVDIGRLMSRIAGDTTQMRTIVQSVIADLAEAPFEIAVSVGYVIWYAVENHMIPTLAIILVAFPAFVVPLRVAATRIRRWMRTALMRASVVLARIHEVLTCIRLVKSMNTESYENGLYAEANRSLVKAQLRNVRITEAVRPTIEFVGILVLCGFVCWCFVEQITLDQVLPMLAPLLVIYKPTKKLAKLQVILENAMGAMSRIFSLADVHMEIPESAHPRAKASFDDRIVFDRVSFRYDTQSADAVKEVSFELRRGAKVAVVGGTGSGKSTLAALLARFADPSSGRVTLDGIDLRELAVDDLRRLVGVVTQETLLFNESVAYNIAYGKPSATADEIRTTAREANADGFIMSERDGYARLCGEKGYALSGGERQRVSIACALLRNPPILILDEATSALDNVTERQVQEALETLMKDRTTFVIAHRLSTIRNADLILVMDHGRIVERGTHDDLYAAGGVYRKLCDMQDHG